MQRGELPLVLVEWEDSSQPVPQWQWLDSISKAAAVQCITVGFLLVDDGEIKMVAQNVGDIHNPERQVSGVITIPARAVTRMTRLGARECKGCPLPMTLGSSSQRSSRPSSISGDPDQNPCEG